MGTVLRELPNLDENTYKAGIKVSDEEFEDKNAQVIDSKWNKNYS